MIAQMQMNRFYEKELIKFKLNYLEALLLAALYFEGDEHSASPSALTKALSMAPARISTALTMLLKKGLVTRSLSDQDYRRVQIRLTPKGLKKSLEAVGLFHKKQIWIEKAVGEKSSKDLTALLHKLHGELARQAEQE